MPYSDMPDPKFTRCQRAGCVLFGVAIWLVGVALALGLTEIVVRLPGWLMGP